MLDKGGEKEVGEEDGEEDGNYKACCFLRWEKNPKNVCRFFYKDN